MMATRPGHSTGWAPRKRGAYRAKPARRAYLPKPDGRQWPLGVVVPEDKTVRRATTGAIHAVCETDSLGFSCGFRPGRRQHDALDALHSELLTRKVNWVLDADIRGFFDAIGREWLMKLVEHRVADQRVGRLIRKWLNARVLEDGKRKSSWAQVYRLAACWLPTPRILHPYPEQRLAVMTQGRNPVR